MYLTCVGGSVFVFVFDCLFLFICLFIHPVVCLFIRLFVLLGGLQDLSSISDAFMLYSISLHSAPANYHVVHLVIFKWKRY